MSPGKDKHKFFFIWLVLVVANVARAGEITPLPVYYLGQDPAIKERVFLTPDTRSASDLDEARVIVLQNAVPDDAERGLMIAQVRQGKGLVILMGPKVEASFLSALYGQTVELTRRDQAIIVSFYQPTPTFWRQLWNRARGIETNLEPHWSQAGQLDWSSLPQVYDRFAPNKSSPFGKPLVLDEKGGEGILFEGRVGSGRVYLLTAWLLVDPEASLSRKENKNYNLLVWPFFNYLLHGMIVEAAGESPPRFADWEGSPMLRPQDRKWIGIGLTALVLANLIVFLLVRRWSRRHRAPLHDFAQALWKHDTFDLKDSRHKSHWQDAGFYRPLSGFLIKFLLWMILGLIFIPPAVWVLNNILIFPTIKGVELLVSGTMGVLFFIFDLGIDDAAIKFYSEYRVKDPERAVQYFQFLNWWEILTGLVQIVLVTLAAFYLMPNTVWAYLALAFFCFSTLQWPGFTEQFFDRVFQAYQRFDYQHYFDFIESVFKGILMTVSLYGWRRWGLHHPRFGEAWALTFSAVTIVSLWQCTNFGLGYFFYRSLGYPLKVMFQFHCDWELIKSALLFGYNLTIRSIIDKIDKFLWVAILAVLLINYLEASAIIAMAMGVVESFLFLDAIHRSILPGFSESYSQGRLILSRHYVIQSLYWGFLGTSLIAMLILPIARPIGSLLEPQWSRLGLLLYLAYLSSFFTYFANMPDTMFKAAGKTKFIPLVGIILLAVKVIFLFLLVPSLQMQGAMIVLILVNITDVAVSWFLFHRYILQLHLNVFRLALPLVLTGIIANGVIFSIRSLLLLLGIPGIAALVVLTWLMIGPFFILTAVLGGWNDLTFDEFERATRVNRPVARIMRPVLLLIQWGRKHRLLSEYQPEDRAAVQADADLIVAARMHEENRETATVAPLGEN